MGEGRAAEDGAGSGEACPDVEFDFITTVMGTIEEFWVIGVK